MIMKTILKAVRVGLVAGLIAAPVSIAHAWGGWGPWSGGPWNGFNNWGNEWGPFDTYQDRAGDFSMNFGSSGSGYGSGEGYGYNRGNYGGYPYGGYGYPGGGYGYPGGGYGYPGGGYGYPGGWGGPGW